MSVNNLLSRLNKVKKSGQNSWMACCPSHADKQASLIITDNGDGHVLLNCFAGCDTYNILKSVGLDWDDVMPEKAIGHRISQKPQIIYSTEAMRLIRYEAQIICLCGFDMSKGKQLDEADIERMKLAMQRINKALELANVTA